MCAVIIIMYCFLAISLQAQDSISGKVTDLNNSPLEHVLINGLDQKLNTKTKSDGTYILEDCNDSIICFSIYGFYDTCINIINIRNNSVDAKLVEKKIVVDEVVISSQSSTKVLNSVQTGLFEIKTDSLRNLPSIVGEADPMRLLQLSPGVSKSDFNMGLNVRGSTTDQNMVLVDDAIIYNPTHLAGFLSVFNPLVIEKVTLLKSGIPSEYGGRVSSITIVETDKNLATRTSFESNVGILLSGFALKTPIVKNKISFQIAARRSYIDQTIKPISRIIFTNNRSMFNNTDYGFYDINAGFTIAAGENDKIFINCYLGNDDFSLQKTSFNLKYDMSWGNQAYSSKWLHHFSARHIMKTVTYYSNGVFEVYVGQNDFNLHLNSNLTDYSLSHEHTFFLDRGNLKVGIQALKQNILPNKSKAELIDFNADFGTPNIFKTLTLSAFSQVEYSLTNRLAFAVGIRFNNYMHLGPFNRFIRSNGVDISDTIKYETNKIVKSYNNLEPRFSLNYKVDSITSVKLSVTRNIQYLQQVNVSSVALPADFWMPASYQLSPQEGLQFAIGYYRSLFNSKYFISTELFYKHLENLTEFRKGILSTVSKATMEENIITGSGRAYGIEFLFEKKVGKLTGWISYTLSRSERIFDEINSGKAYPSKYDRTHDLSVISQYKINNKWSVSAVFVVASGTAVTLPYGRYMVGQNIINQYVDYNSFRMPVYHRLDISATRKFVSKNKAEHSLDFGIYNVYSRLNPFFMYFNVSGDLEKYKLKIKPRYASVFPMLPSISYHYKF